MFWYLCWHVCVCVWLVTDWLSVLLVCAVHCTAPLYSPLYTVQCWQVVQHRQVVSVSLTQPPPSSLLPPHNTQCRTDALSLSLSLSHIFAWDLTECFIIIPTHEVTDRVGWMKYWQNRWLRCSQCWWWYDYSPPVQPSSEMFPICPVSSLPTASPFASLC